MKEVFILDDQESRVDRLRRRAIGRFRVRWCSSVGDAKLVLSAATFDIVMLDHDLLDQHYAAQITGEPYVGDTGLTMASWMADHRELFGSCRVIVHSRNWKESAKMVKLLTEAGINAYHYPGAEEKI